LVILIFSKGEDRWTVEQTSWYNLVLDKTPLSSWCIGKSNHDD
jgi:hypothetical protein